MGRYRFLVLMSWVFLTSCLQTRAQLREESQNEDRVNTSQSAPASAGEPVSGNYESDEIKLEITRLEGRMQDLERAQKESQTSEQSSGGLKEDLKKMEDRLAKLEASHAELVESMKKGQRSESVVQDPNLVFESAKSSFQQNDHEKAIQGFSSYLKMPRIKKGEEATFLLAESYFKTKQFKNAIVEYSKFPEHFKKSTHLPEALLKIGFCFDSLGMKDDAKGFYQELIEKFPKSPQAKKAKAKI